MCSILRWLKNLSCRAACSVIVISCSTAAWSATLDDVSPGLRRDAGCMFHVLKTQVRGIDNITLGVWDDGQWVYPYVEYRAAPDKTGFRYVVRFIACPAVHA